MFEISNFKSVLFKKVPIFDEILKNLFFPVQMLSVSEILATLFRQMCAQETPNVEVPSSLFSIGTSF